MQSNFRRIFSMAGRALGFATANPSSDASYTALVGRLKDAVAKADVLAVQQNDGDAGERSALSQRMQLRRDLEVVMIPHLIQVASFAAETQPELTKAFRRPLRGIPNRALIAVGKSLIAAAQPYKDLFLSLGLGNTFFDDFTAALAQFDVLTDTAHSGRRDHVGARAELEVLAKECLRMVKVLDGTFRVRFKNDPESLAAWMSSRNLPGPFTHHGNGAGGDVPSPDPVPPPAPQPEPVIPPEPPATEAAA
ncbi:MAG: hypothetical protein ACREL5_03720 [Gemmatimonadales bacterium]